jgi:hypothetical protein
MVCNNVALDELKVRVDPFPLMVIELVAETPAAWLKLICSLNTVLAITLTVTGPETPFVFKSFAKAVNEV